MYISVLSMFVCLKYNWNKEKPRNLVYDEVEDELVVLSGKFSNLLKSGPQLQVEKKKKNTYIPLRQK